MGSAGTAFYVTEQCNAAGVDDDFNDRAAAVALVVKLHACSVPFQVSVRGESNRLVYVSGCEMCGYCDCFGEHTSIIARSQETLRPL